MSPDLLCILLQLCHLCMRILWQEEQQKLSSAHLRALKLQQGCVHAQRKFTCEIGVACLLESACANVRQRLETRGRRGSSFSFFACSSFTPPHFRTWAREVSGHLGTGASKCSQKRHRYLVSIQGSVPNN